MSEIVSASIYTVVISIWLTEGIPLRQTIDVYCTLSSSGRRMPFSSSNSLRWDYLRRRPISYERPIQSDCEELRLCNIFIGDAHKIGLHFLSFPFFFFTIVEGQHGEERVYDDCSTSARPAIDPGGIWLTQWPVLISAIELYNLQRGDVGGSSADERVLPPRNEAESSNQKILVRHYTRPRPVHSYNKEIRETKQSWWKAFTRQCHHFTNLVQDFGQNGSQYNFFGIGQSWVDRFWRDVCDCRIISLYTSIERAYAMYKKLSIWIDIAYKYRHVQYILVPSSRSISVVSSVQRNLLCPPLAFSSLLLLAYWYAVYFFNTLYGWGRKHSLLCNLKKAMPFWVEKGFRRKEKRKRDRCTPCSPLNSYRIFLLDCLGPQLGCYEPATAGSLYIYGTSIDALCCLH